MDIVNNVDDAQPTEEEIIPEDSLVGKEYTPETFDTEWRNAYLHITESLRRVYEQVGDAMKVQLETKIPDFDPVDNEEHKDLFERSVTQKVGESGAQDHLMGVLKGILVPYHTFAKRYGFETKDIVANLNNLTKNTDVNANVKTLKREMGDGS